MISGQNLLDQPVKNNFRIYDKIRKITTAQGYDCTTGCFLCYNDFNKDYNTIAIGIIKQQVLDPDPKIIQQFNFAENLIRERMQMQQCFSLLKRQKKPF